MPMDIFELLSDTTRRKILQLVSENELTAGAIAAHFKMSRPAVSQHLAKLKQGEAVAERRVGTTRLYCAQPSALIQAGLFFDSFWDSRLTELQRIAEVEPDAGISPERFSIEKEVLLGASPSKVWRLLTKADSLCGWMGVTSTLELRPGGKYVLEVVPGRFVRGEVVEVQRARRLSHTWGWDEGGSVPSGSTLVSYDLLPTKTGTLLHLTHRHLLSVQATQTHANGWNHYLDRLRIVATGTTAPIDPWVADPKLLRTELFA